MRRRKNILKRRQITAVVCVVLLLISIPAVLAIRGKMAQFRNYGFARELPEAEQRLRLTLVEAAESWLGSNEADGSHRAIIDRYNSHTPLAQGYTVQYDDQWCATFVSASAIEAGLTQIIPTECGCQRQIGLFQELGTWQEDDTHIPLPGDIIYYSRSNTNNTNDCTGWSDHVGIVVGTSGNWIKVIEGNYGDRVGHRYIKADATIIRGYAVPDYSLLIESQGAV